MLAAGIVGAWLAASILYPKLAADGLAGSAKILGPFFIYPALFVLAPDERGMEALTLVVALTVIVIGSVDIAQTASLFHSIHFDPFRTTGKTSATGLSDAGAEYIAGALPLLVSQFIFGQRLRDIVVLSIAIIEGVVYVIVSHSMASWAAVVLAGLAGICLLAYVRRRRKLRINLSPLYIVGIVLAGTLLLSLISSQTHSLIGSVLSVFDAWHLGNNSEYVRILTTIGVPGMLLFIGLLALIVYGFLSGIEKAAAEHLPVLVGGLLGVVSLIVMALFSFPFGAPGTGFLFWVYAGIDGLYSPGSLRAHPPLWKALSYVFAVLGLAVFFTAFRIALARAE